MYFNWEKRRVYVEDSKGTCLGRSVLDEDCKNENLILVILRSRNEGSMNGLQKAKGNR